jgi:hypothetical protein
LTNVLRITKQRDIVGIRHWFQYMPMCIPRYEVFRFEGRCEKGLYWFRSVKNTSCLIHKNFAQLNDGGFHPFCLDWQRIDNHLEKINGPTTA